jgi:hypothetical protein
MTVIFKRVPGIRFWLYESEYSRRFTRAPQTGKGAWQRMRQQTRGERRGKGKRKKKKGKEVEPFLVRGGRARREGRRKPIPAA